MKPETKIVHQIEKWISDNGGEVLKLHGSAMQRSGEPDLIGGFGIGTKYPNAKFVYEVKLPGETPREDQMFRLSRWRRAGFSVGWGTSLEDFVAFANKWGTIYDSVKY